jgi:hypothetical protein
MYINLNAKYSIREHYEVLFNIELVMKNFRILYICEYENIFPIKPSIKGMSFKYHNNSWFIYKSENSEKIYTENSFLQAISLNYLEPTYDINAKKYILQYYISIISDTDNMELLLYTQCINNINLCEINKQVNQIKKLICVHDFITCFYKIL